MTINYTKENFNIGCSGWSYKDWKPCFYPETLPSKEYFSYYATFFNTVEINNTFYCFPTQKTLKLWYNQAPQGFKYSIKVNRYITHKLRFKEIEEPLKTIYGIGDILNEKLQHFLFQFPPSFVFSDEKLERIISQLNQKYQNVIEFRHPSWWRSKVIQIFEANNILFCTVNGFDLPESPIIINKKMYCRFHGAPVYSSLYSGQFLSYWTSVFKKEFLKESWIYFNNTMYGYAPQNALASKELL
ncbi:MAG: DUF72 domain-containing protein [Alphaproteobacteria bacterium]|nr:DUF72 domain-containing protein [Alphaproteobacteria bacterium]